MKESDVIRIIDDMKRRFVNLDTFGSKYKFSRNWYQAYFNSADYHAVDDWCEQHFGPHPKHPDAWSRWWHKFEDSILFRDEKDYVLFMLRWS
jgi:hypothetical protein